MVGESDNRAFIYTGGKLQDLNTLIPAGSGAVLTEATGINDAGQIVCNGGDEQKLTPGGIYPELIDQVYGCTPPERKKPCA